LTTRFDQRTGRADLPHCHKTDRQRNRGAHQSEQRQVAYLTARRGQIGELVAHHHDQHHDTPEHQQFIALHELLVQHHTEQPIARQPQ
jgi:hypothetical protein